MESAFTQIISGRDHARYGPDHYELDTLPSALDGSQAVSLARQRHDRAGGRLLYGDHGS